MLILHTKKIHKILQKGIRKTQSSRISEFILANLVIQNFCNDIRIRKIQVSQRKNEYDKVLYGRKILTGLINSLKCA